MPLTAGSRLGVYEIAHLLGVVALLGYATLAAQAPTASFDVIIRHGTVIDGSGRARFAADVGVRNGFITSIGDLSAAKAPIELEARGLFVAPGFINIHSHASPDALPTAVNMLTQGVTTEIFNADGAGPLDIAKQMADLSAAGSGREHRRLHRLQFRLAHGGRRVGFDGLRPRKSIACAR